MFEKMLGQAPNFEALLRSARIVAMTDATVLITGETGTGKELLALAIQHYSPRSRRPFITINCSALPEFLAESELFGHRKGSFSGAMYDQVGRLQAAHGGTVFLDEVDSLSIPLQAKLLRFLETGELQPVGQATSPRVDVRIIAATNSHLPERIGRGEFRRDLYYRLNVVPLEIPSLRERIGDVQVLLSHFIRQFPQDHALPPVSISNAALNHLLAYPWPGNVRELRNVCERLCVLLAGCVIDETNLPAEIVKRQPAQTMGIALPEYGLDLLQVEGDLIRQALDRTNGNRTHSAKLLGISRDTLLYRIQKHRVVSQAQ